MVCEYTIKRRLAKGWTLEAATNTPSLGIRADLVGQRFGRLTVLAFADYKTNPNGSKHALWKCVCDCGKEVTVTANNLRSKTTKSCGCLHVERPTLRRLARGHEVPVNQMREFHAWRSMLDRCRRPKCKEYKWYGARGITVCERWLMFDNFREDMGPCPEGLTIDRIDTDGHYEPGNCRWITQKANCNNKRNNVLVDVGERRMTASEAAELLNVPLWTLLRRAKAGLPLTSVRPKQPPLTHCKRGHPFAPETTYIRPNGSRMCRVCARAIDKRRSPAA